MAFPNGTVEKVHAALWGGACHQPEAPDALTASFADGVPTWGHHSLDLEGAC